MSQALENYDPFTDDSGAINDWLYEDDTCAFCGAARTKECESSEHGWTCPACRKFNFNGSGKNDPDSFDE